MSNLLWFLFGAVVGLLAWDYWISQKVDHWKCYADHWRKAWRRTGMSSEKAKRDREDREAMENLDNVLDYMSRDE